MREQHRIRLLLRAVVDPAGLKAGGDRVAHRDVALEEGIDRRVQKGPADLIVIAGTGSQEEREDCGRADGPNYDSQVLRKCTPARCRTDGPRTYRDRWCRPRDSRCRAG